MLRDTKRWDPIQRNIIIKVRRLHLKQQQIEREHLETIKARARRVDPSMGKPSRGNTPQAGVVRRSKPGRCKK